MGRAALGEWGQEKEAKWAGVEGGRLRWGEGRGLRKAF